MRLCSLLLFAFAGNLSAGDGPTNAEYPLWDGQESVAQYAERAGLPPTQTLDLGKGVKLELVLIPAGRFLMGTPEPEVVDEERYLKKIEMGIALLAVSGEVIELRYGNVTRSSAA